jgi:hypothetical protein
MIDLLDDPFFIEDLRKLQDNYKPINTYQEFVDKLIPDVKEIIELIQESVNHQVKKEDLLSIQIVHLLKCKNYNATSDTNLRGHCDILVKYKTFSWIGEAKIYKSNPWLLKGVSQVLHRYSTGNHNQSHSALIIYIFQKDCLSKMKEWNKYFETYTIEGKHSNRFSIQNITNNIDSDLTFTSVHRHEASGMDFNFLHLPVYLHFDPLDPEL